MAPAFWCDSCHGNTNRLGNQSTTSMLSQLSDSMSSSLPLFPVAVRWPPICHPTPTGWSILMTYEFYKSLLPKSEGSQNSSAVTNSFPRLLLTFHVEEMLIPHPGWNCHMQSYLLPTLIKDSFIFYKTHRHFSPLFFSQSIQISNSDHFLFLFGYSQVCAALTCW